MSVVVIVVIAIIIIITIVIGSVVSCTNSWFYNFSPIHSVTTLVMRVIRKLHLLLFYLAEMVTHDKMSSSSFDRNKEQRTLYAERLDFYFEANNVTSAETKRAIFLTVCGPSTFQLLISLVQPNTSKKELY